MLELSTIIDRTMTILSTIVNNEEADKPPRLVIALTHSCFRTSHHTLHNERSRTKMSGEYNVSDAHHPPWTLLTEPLAGIRTLSYTGKDSILMSQSKPLSITLLFLTPTTFSVKESINWVLNDVTA